MMPERGTEEKARRSLLALRWAHGFMIRQSWAGRKGGKHDSDNQTEIQGKSDALLRAEHLRDLGRNRQPDERRHHDADLRRDSFPDLGARKRAGLHCVRILRDEDPEGPGSLRQQDHEMGLRRDVHLPGVALHERNADGVRRHAAGCGLRHGHRLHHGRRVPGHPAEIRHDPERADGRIRMDYRLPAGPGRYNRRSDP